VSQGSTAADGTRLCVGGSAEALQRPQDPPDPWVDIGDLPVIDAPGDHVGSNRGVDTDMGANCLKHGGWLDPDVLMEQCEDLLERKLL
jgi:hypothetical protein